MPRPLVRRRAREGRAGLWDTPLTLEHPVLVGAGRHRPRPTTSYYWKRPTLPARALAAVQVLLEAVFAPLLPPVVVAAVRPVVTPMWRGLRALDRGFAVAGALVAAVLLSLFSS